LHVVHSLWWDEASQAFFDAEIVPYFKTLAEATDYRVIVDAGAATGLFSMAAAVLYPHARVYAFEPSRRQRVLLHRNLGLNGLDDRITVADMGLWDRNAVLAFRTHGAISSLQSVSQFPPGYPCLERIQVGRLDEWVAETGAGIVGLVKMDIEGAELEALRGAETTLRNHRPDLLVQAYHQRDGTRTLERCATFLGEVGYTCREVGSQSGMLYATHRH
jgi:FkbM family methyltransferase